VHQQGLDHLTPPRVKAVHPVIPVNVTRLESKHLLSERRQEAIGGVWVQGRITDKQKTKRADYTTR